MHAFDDDDTPGTPRSSRGSTIRRHGRRLASDWDLKSRLPSRLILDDHASLLDNPDGRPSYRAVASAPQSPRKTFKRRNSAPGSERRSGTLGSRVAKALGAEANIVEEDNQQKLSDSIYYDDRVWYDQYTSTDWVQDSISDAFRLKELRSRKGFRGRAEGLFDSAQGWILVALIGCVTAGIAYIVDVSESVIFDLKTGYCSHAWYYGKKSCCGGASTCDQWSRWSLHLTPGPEENGWFDYAAFVFWVIFLSIAACLITLQTKTVISSAISLSTLDENLAAQAPTSGEARKDSIGSPMGRFAKAAQRPPMVYYPAAGSGVAEVKVILSGFIIRGYLGLRTLIFKTLGLILSVASGLSLGKEGPFVHIATCVGNVACRMFEKYHVNDAKRREILSASAASGVAVAFGSPIGGVLFSLESQEMSNYFPLKTLWRSYFCALVATAVLSAMNPFRTGQLVMFTVSYDRQWHFFEIFFYIILGIFGGLYGAFVIKWNLRMQAFRKRYLTQYPILEATILATATAILCYPNKFLRIDMTESMEILFLECEGGHDYDGLCDRQNRWSSVFSLLIATVLRTFLVIISYGCKVPAGIFVPSMAIGASFGRMVGILVQATQQAFPNAAFFSACQPDMPCITPGTYAFLGAAAALSGIMHITVSVVVIMFELTGALTYILPTMIVVGVTKAVSDRFGKGGIADRMIWFNGMPFLDNKEDHAFGVPVSTAMTSELKALPISGLEVRDIEKLLEDTKYSGYPIVEDATSMMLVGYAGRTELRYALDRARRDQMATPRTKCFFTPVAGHVPITPSTPNPAVHFDYLSASSNQSSVDLSKFIDATPITVHPRLPLETVMELFKKLGPRVILVEYRGRLTGLITVKDCLKYQFQAEAHENPKDDSALREAQDRLWEVIRKTAGWISSRLLFLKRHSHVRLPSNSDGGITPRTETSAEGRAAARNGDVELEHRT
ncbi:CLC voltage-gated chloride channel [Aureobasidium pullulans]|uniref:Chloride channel protein n=1 Tax=Aureobasidium pullulans TaxID=5580 RepID=A0A4S9VH81_AURPU|nr:CLC voltage-gated chloride channel [Aureobasidium pullulans]